MLILDFKNIVSKLLNTQWNIKIGYLHCIIYLFMRKIYELRPNLFRKSFRNDKNRKSVLKHYSRKKIKLYSLNRINSNIFISLVYLKKGFNLIICRSNCLWVWYISLFFISESRWPIIGTWFITGPLTLFNISHAGSESKKC